MTRTARKLILGMTLGVAVLAGFLFYLEAGNAGAIRERLGAFAWWTFAAALGLALLNYGLRFVRWQLYLERSAVEVAPALSGQVFLAGFAFSITPGKIGELVKSYLLRHLARAPVARTAPIVVTERITDLIALLILGLIGALVYGVARSTAITGAVVVAGGLVALSSPGLARAAIDLATRPGFLRRFRARLHLFHSGLAELVRPRPLAVGTAIAALAWLAECVGFALIANGFPGVEVPMGLAITIYATTTVVGALSFLPGGLLVTEAAMTLLLVQASAGLDEPGAVAATFLTRLATLWFAVVLGLGALMFLRRRYRGVSQAIERRLAADGNQDEDE